MTIEEILRRIVRAHLPTIIVCTLLPLLLVTLLQVTSAPTYVGRVRMQTSSTTPASTTQADSLSSRVFAVATTPSIVRAALRDAHQPATRDAAVQVATHDVSAQRLGESPVVELAVLAKHPQTANKIATALGHQVVAFMNEAGGARFDTAMAAPSTRRWPPRRPSATSSRTCWPTPSGCAPAPTSAARSRRRRTPSTTSPTSAPRWSWRTRTATSWWRSTSASRPCRGCRRRCVPRAALALLLGLLVGLAAAVVQETLSPRIAGIRVLARLLDAPLLGTTGQLWASLAESMTLAARRQGVETLVLVGVDERDEKVAKQLREALPGIWNQDMVDTTSSSGPSSSTAKKTGQARGDAKGTDASRDTVRLSSRLRFTDRYGVTAAEEPAAGVVVISTGNARRSQLDGVQDMVRAMRWPVVGVVEVNSRRTEVGAS